ncbi:FecCD family ABC transporter permease [Microbacterium immunditiarum]|uniref:Iron complex transport system permease protein n=1 Tax=Microbacterium immunditiarum TaxID=337480 RepID=A0A7Y9GPJ7_9MICO|nr:iron complex transport system permease protein [Microbacterium immunditiarum]
MTAPTSLDTPVAAHGTFAASAIAASRRRRVRRSALITAGLGAAIVVVFALSLMIGRTLYTPLEVLDVLAGHMIPGASFTVGELRLPRAALGLLAGFSFGIAGVTFQTMLRNPLASPDIIGISSGATAAAVFGIVVLSQGETAVSLLALGGALVSAFAIYLLSNKGGFAGTRLILIGIGVAAMLDAAVTYLLSKAAAWDLQAALRWITGSLNGASWPTVLPLAIACIVVVPALLSQSRNLGVLRLGDDSAAGLGVRVTPSRVVAILAAVTLLAFATAATGPIAFVAFMAGPIAARVVGSGSALLLPSGFIGALLVLVADLIGQFAFDARYPVGVITGVVGAPYLIYLLIRTNRSGGSL